MTWPTKTDFVDGDVLTAAQVNNIGTNLNLYNPTSATAGQVPVADGAGSVAFGTPTSAFAIQVPTSVDQAGGSATFNTDGSVSFTTVTTLSLNGVFTATATNYVIVLKTLANSGNNFLQLRMRAAGTDNTTASSYVTQRNLFYSTTSSLARITNTYAQVGYVSSHLRDGTTINIYAPFLAEPTAISSLNSAGNTTNNPITFLGVANHNQSTSYDGVTLYPDSQNMTGIVTVYALGD